MTGRGPGLDWCPIRSEWYALYTGRAPRVRLVTHRHTCPDGTRVVVTAQYIALLEVTLYRWTVDGEDAGTTRAVCLATVPPDWARVDAAHLAAA